MNKYSRYERGVKMKTKQSMFSKINSIPEKDLMRFVVVTGLGLWMGLILTFGIFKVITNYFGL